MATDRVDKFLEDQNKALLSSSTSKIIPEIEKLRSWLQKHQNESLPDAAKGKLLTILEKYNRAQGYFAAIRSNVQNLFNDYLQMPEGKLVNAKNKSKVLIWSQNMTDDDNDQEEGKEKEVIRQETLSQWTVESIDKKKKTLTLLNVENPDLWKEDWKAAVNLQEMWGSIEAMMVEVDDKGAVMIELNDNTGEIVSLSHLT
eukprot:gene6185-6820_t